MVTNYKIDKNWQNNREAKYEDIIKLIKVVAAIKNDQRDQYAKAKNKYAYDYRWFV